MSKENLHKTETHYGTRTLEKEHYGTKQTLTIERRNYICFAVNVNQNSHLKVMLPPANYCFLYLFFVCLFVCLFTARKKVA